jgi:hypothetical protein
MDRAVLDTALDRAPVNDDGRSGAVVERVVLADGSRVVVKRFDPAVDLVMRISALQREVAGPAYDGDAMRLGLLAGICWLGWNKALDIVEHPDPAVRERERVALPWWLRQAELALEAGLM